MDPRVAPLRIGLSVPTWPRADGTIASWPELRALALEAEALGVDRLWVPDHLIRELPSGRSVDFLECWTILTATAEATGRIGVGSFVACTGFRNPGLLARMADTLGAVSGGRLVLGLGSGTPSGDASWRIFGFDSERPVARFAESVEVVARMLRGEVVTFEGAQVRVHGARIAPPPADRPAVPIWAAAKGDRTMDVAARWADAVNVNSAIAAGEDAAAVVASAHAACRRVGRDPATLAVTGYGRIALDAQGVGLARAGWLAGPPEAIAATLRDVAGRGVEEIALYLGTDEDPSPLPALTRRALERFAPVLEAIRAS